LDKALGQALKQDLNFTELAAFLSGRINLEMIVKCARAGITVVAGISAPSTKI
ncbi:MAG: formate dehydrogenase accessory sulfurtransferase FdhD, partial [Planctomycetes bacterium]|nr:formate dehydrogenase accessory sulfurtransferase FdhD [Planctomycetota bacterium]